MLYGKFADNGDIPVNNPNIRSVDENNGLSKMFGLQPLKCVENLFSVRFRNCIFYTGNNL